MIKPTCQQWSEALSSEFSKEYFRELEAFVDAARASSTVYPAPSLVFRAFDECPLDKVRVVVLGQDPYHDGSACGLCFAIDAEAQMKTSGKPRVKVPPSAQNILKEFASDLGLSEVPSYEIFNSWPGRGVLMLNAIMTVEAGRPLSHQGHGWETFTDAVIRLISERCSGVVFLLWGSYAQGKEALIDCSKHHVLKAAHPSPLARGKFFGSRPFSSANKLLGEEIFTAPAAPLKLF